MNENQLDKFKISIKYISSPNEFFDLPNVKLTEIPQSFLEHKQSENIRENPDEGYYLLRLHDLVMKDDANTIPFVYEILKILNYQKNTRMILQKQKFTLNMDSGNKIVKPDICIMDEDTILAIIHQSQNIKDGEHKIIESAIAAFQHNNHIRQLFEGNVHSEQTFPCITFVSSHPRFYKILITESFNKCIIRGHKPKSNIIILCYDPFISTSILGMYEIEDRIHALKCIKRFRKMINRFNKFDVDDLLSEQTEKTLLI